MTLKTQRKKELGGNPAFLQFVGLGLQKQRRAVRAQGRRELGAERRVGPRVLRWTSCSPPPARPGPSDARGTGRDAGTREGAVAAAWLGEQGYEAGAPPHRDPGAPHPPSALPTAHLPGERAQGARRQEAALETSQQGRSLSALLRRHGGAGPLRCPRDGGSGATPGGGPRQRAEPGWGLGRGQATLGSWEAGLREGAGVQEAVPAGGACGGGGGGGGGGGICYS